MSDLLIRDGVLFCCLKKNASTSLYKAFRGTRVASNRRRYQADDSVDGSIVVCGTFLRNPYTRLVSVWKNLIVVDNPRNFYSPFENMKIRYNCEFEEFIDAVLSCPDEDRDHHIQSQYNQVKEQYDEYHDRPWFFGTVENLWEDWPRFLKHCSTWTQWKREPIPLNSSLEHHNKGKPQIRSELENADWEKIRDHFKMDYLLWESAVKKEPETARRLLGYD